MMKWLTYDLETTFIKRGMKRTDTMIIEIALYGKDPPKGRTLMHYQTLVNPLIQYSTGEEVRNSLDSYGQNVNSSINFWVKLLIEKKMINSAVKRKSMEDQSDVIAALLTNEADKFKPMDVALKEALRFGQGFKWIAHNGTSFDSKIIKGNCEKLEIPQEVDFSDSLHLFKHHLKGEPSYSQPILYKSLFKDKYMAHHALEDAKALHKMLVHVAVNKSVIDMFEEIPKKKSRKKKLKIKTDLLDIKGVGPGSAAVFVKNNIQSKKELHDYILNHNEETFLKTFSKVYSYKKLADKLYSGEIKLLYNVDNNNKTDE